MNISNITNVYDNMTDSILTNNNCTNDSEDIIIPALIFSGLSGKSFLCLISFMVYTLIKPLINK